MVLFAPDFLVLRLLIPFFSPVPSIPVFYLTVGSLPPLPDWIMDETQYY